MPVTIPRNEELASRARELYVPGVFGIKRVARELGISESSVRRYVNPEYAERQRALSLAAKRRRRGICERCGGETRYNGRTTNGPSSLCAACSSERWTHCANGHEFTPDTDLRWRNDRYHGWSCRICRNEYMREYQKRRYATDPAVREKKRIENKRRYQMTKSEGATQNG